MPEEKSSDIGELLKKYLHKLLYFRLAIFEKRMKKYIVSIMIVLAAFIVFLDGLSMYLGSFFPWMEPGMSHIIIGAVFILAAWIYRKSD